MFGFLVFVVLFYQFYKLAIRGAKRDGAATVMLQTVAGISILALAPFFPLRWPTDWRTWGLLGLACIFYAINDRLQTTGRKHLQVSVFSMVNQVGTVFLIIYGLTVFHEVFMWQKVAGAGLILLGNMFLLYRKGSFEINKYVVISILATLAFATALSIDIGVSGQFNLPVYIMLSLVVPAVMIAAVERIHPRESIAEFAGDRRKYFLATGLAWGLAIFFSLRSFQFGKVTTIVPLQATSVLINVLVAYFVLDEKDNAVKKILAALVIVGGVCLAVI